MPLGYCMECKQLKAIRPVALQLGSRQCEWRPVDHRVAIHPHCGSILDVDEETAVAVCRACGPLAPGTTYLIERCAGTDRDIR